MVEKIGLAATMEMGQFNAGMQQYINGVMGMATTSEKSGSRAQNALNAAMASVESSLNKALDAQKRYRLELEVGEAAYKKAAETGTASAAQLQLQQMHLDSLRAKLQETGAAVATFATQQQRLGTELEKVNTVANSFGGKAATTIGGVFKGLGEGVGGAIKGIGEIGGTLGKVGATITGFLGPIGKIGSVAISAFSGVGKAATNILGTAFGGVGKVISGLIPHFGKARDEMGQMGGEAQKTGGIIQTALGVALGNVITNTFEGILSTIKNTIGSIADFGQAYEIVGQYEMLSQTLGSMVAMEERRNTAVEKTIGTQTTRISLTEKEAKALAAAQENQRKYNNDIAIAQERYDKAAAGGKTSAAALDNLAIAIDKAKSKAQGAADTIATLSGKEGQLVTTSKTATEYTLTMAQAMEKTSAETASLIKWAKDLALWSPFGDQDVTSALQMGMALGSTTDEAKRQTQALMDWAAATGKGGDVISRMVVNLGQMKAAGKIYGGELRQMAYMGFPIRDILSKELGVSASQMDNLAESGLDMKQVMEAIMHSLEEDYGGMAAKMGGTLSGMKESLGTLKTESTRLLWTGIFDAIKPIMLEVVNMLTDPSFTTAISAMGDRIGAFAAKIIQPLWAGIKGLIGFAPQLGSIFDFLKTGDQGKLGGVIDGLAKLLGMSSGEAVAKFQGFFSFLSSIQPTVQLVVAAFQSLGSAIGYLVTGDADKLTAVWEKLAPTGKWEPIHDFLMGARDALAGIGAVISSFASGDSDKKIKAVFDAFGSLTDIGISPEFADAIIGVAEAIGTFAKGIGGAFKLLKGGDFKGAIGKVFEAFKGFGDDIGDALGKVDWKKIWDTLFGKAKDLLAKVDWAGIWDTVKTTAVSVLEGVDWSGIWETIKTKIPAVLDKASEMAGLLGDKIKAWWEDSALKAKIDAAIPIVGEKLKTMLIAAIEWLMGQTTAMILSFAGVVTSILSDDGAVPKDAGTIGQIGASLKEVVAAGIDTIKENSDELGDALGKLMGPIIKRAWNYILTGQAKEQIDWGEFFSISTGSKSLSGDKMAGRTGLFDKLFGAADVGKSLAETTDASIKKNMTPAYWNTTLNTPMANLEKRMKEGGKDAAEGLAAGIDDGKGAVEDAIREVADLVPDRLEDEWMMQSPSRLFMQIGSEAIEGLTIGIEASSDSALKAVAEMSESIVGIVQGMIEAINSMASAPETGNIQAWGTAIVDTLNMVIGALTGMYDVAGGPKANAIDLTRRLSKAFSDVVAFVSDVAEGFTALAEVDLTQLTMEKISGFMAKTHILLQAIVEEAGFWGATEAEIKAKFAGARKLTDQILDVFRIVTASVEAIVAMADYVEVLDLEKKMKSWKGSLIIVLDYIRQAAIDWGERGLGAAGSFADAATRALGVVTSGIDAIAAVLTYKTSDNFPALVEGFRKDTYAIIRSVVSLFNDFTGAGSDMVDLGPVAAFGDQVASALGFISEALDAIEQIVAFKPVGDLSAKAKAFGANVVDLLVALDDAVKLLTLPDRRTGQPTVYLTPDEIRARFADLAAFSTAVQEGIGFIGPSLDALFMVASFIPFEDIHTAAKEFGEQVVTLMFDLQDMVRGLILPARRGGEEEVLTPDAIREKFANLAAFSTAIQESIGFIAPTLEALANVGGYVSIPDLQARAISFGVNVAQLVESLVQMVEIVMNAFRTGTPYYLTPEEVYAKMKGVAEFSEAIQSGIGFIAPTIEAIGGIGGFTSIGDLKAKALTFGLNVKDLILGLDQMVLAIINAFQTGTPYYLSVEEIYAKFEGLARFNEAIQKVIGFIKPTIEAITAIGEYKDIKGLPTKILNFAQDLDMVIRGLQSLAELWVTASEGVFTAPQLEAIGVFSTNVQAAIGFIKPAIDAVKALADYSAAKGLGKAIAAFKLDLGAAITALGELAANPLLSVEALTSLGSFSGALIAVIADLQAAVEALNAIAGYKSGAAVTAFRALQKDLQTIAVVLWEMSNTAISDSGMLGAATQFESAAIAINGAVTRAFEQLGIIGTGGAEGATTDFANKIDSALDGLKGSASSFQNSWVGSWGAVTSAIRTATQALRDFIHTAGEVKIPPAIEGHSPPPLANWMDAIADATRRAKEQFAAMQGGMRSYSLPSSVAAAQAAAAVANNVNVNMGGVNINNGMDQALFEARVRRIVKEAIRA